MIRLNTDRLELVALDSECMQLLVNDRQKLTAVLGLKPYEQEIEPLYRKELDEAMPPMAQKAAAFPEQYPWYSSWEIILRTKQISIGGMGFGAPPDEKGNVLFGYQICKRYWSQGITTEAARALLDWAFTQEAVKTVTAMTPVEHTASQRVLLKNGFRKIRQEEHEGMTVFVFQKP